MALAQGDEACAWAPHLDEELSGPQALPLSLPLSLDCQERRNLSSNLDLPIFSELPPMLSQPGVYF